MKNTIIDAGPLISLFVKDDHYHNQILEFLKGYRGKLLSTWHVLTEVCHLLSDNTNLQIDFLEWVDVGGLEIVEISKEKLPRIIALSKKYKDLPMDLADASLVILAESMNINEIISIDSDYDVYRIFKKQPFRNIFKTYSLNTKNKKG